VAEEVKPPTVQEHRGKGGVPGLGSAQYTDRTGSQANGSSRRRRAQKFAWDQPKFAHRPRKPRLASQTFNEDPGGDVEGDDEDGDDGGGQGRVVVTIGEHPSNI